MSLFLTQQAGGRLALAITILIVGAAVLSVAPQVVEAGDSHTETVGMTIPDGLAGQGVTSTITVSLAGSVDVDGPILLDTLLVTVNITHEYPGDLDIVLLPPYVAWPVPGFYHPSLIPDGAVQLFARDQTLADGENFTNTRFTGSDDSIHKGSSISAASAPYTGTYLPASAGQQAMNDLYGLPPIGTWTIIVMDTDAGDSGTFDSWAITFSDAQEIDVKDPSSSSLTDGDSVDLGIYDTGTANDSTWTIKNTTATSDLTVENIEFRNATNCEASLSRTSFTVAGAASETFTLTVTPDDNGAFSGRLRITSDDPDEEDFDVYISGIAWFPDGDAPDEPLVVGSSDSGGGGFTDPAEAISALGTLGAAGRIDGPVELELAGGTYSSSLELSGISGIDASHPLTISAADGESVVFTGGDSIAGTLFGTSTTALRISNQSYVNIIGIEFDGGGTVENGVLIEASNSNQTQSITIKGCKFHGYTNCALLVYDANIGSNAAGYLVANNTLWDNECSSGWGSVAIVYAGGGDIVHNTLVHNHASYAWYITAIFSAGIINTFSNNITYIENATAAVHLEDTITESFPTAMDHNVWHLDGHKLGQDSDNDTLAEWQTDSGKGANSIEADPLMEDPLDGDMHLIIGSPAIDLGTDVGISDDQDGESRDASPDAGADEFLDPSGAEIRVTYEGTTFVEAIVSSGESIALGNLGDSEPVEFNFTVANPGAADLTLSGGPIDISDAQNVTVNVTQPASTIGVGKTEAFVLGVTARGFTTINLSTISVLSESLLLGTTNDAFAGLEVGDSLTISGFSNTDNNGEATVVAIYDSDQGGGEGNNLIEISGLDMIGEAAGNAITIAATTPRFTVTIPNNDSDESAMTFDVTGTYVASPAAALTLYDEDGNTIAASGTHNAGSRPTNRDFTFSYTLRNDGTAPVTLSGSPFVALDTQGANVSFTTTQPVTDGELSPRESVTFSVVASISSAGTDTVAFDIVSDDPTNPTYTFTLQLTGATVPIAEFDTAVDFGTISFYSSATIAAAGSDTESRISVDTPGDVTSTTRTLVITNNGDAALTVDLQSFSDPRGYWSYQGSSPSGATIGGGTFTIAADSTETLTFVYEPTATVGAPFTATLTIDTDSGVGSGTVSGTPTTITFTGYVTDYTSVSGGGCDATSGGPGNPLTLAVWLLLIGALAYWRRPRVPARP